MPNIKNQRAMMIIWIVIVLTLVASIIGSMFALSFFSLFTNSKNNDNKDLNKEKIFVFADPAIYSSSDNSFSIYGACLDGNAQPLSGASAKITIYNSSGGTVANDLAMTSLSANSNFNFKIQSPATAGNYFVQINCSTSTTYALGHSNFQVAPWTEQSTFAGIGYPGLGFGDGSDGNRTVSSSTTDAAGTILSQYTNFTINSGATLTINSADNYRIILATQSITINGEINVDGRGGAGAAGSDSAGGTGNTATQGGDGGTVSASAVAWCPAGAGGGGGGGGGILVLVYRSLTESGTVSAAGGTGGAGQDSYADGGTGGNGATGLVVQIPVR